MFALVQGVLGGMGPECRTQAQSRRRAVAGDWTPRHCGRCLKSIRGPTAHGRGAWSSNKMIGNPESYRGRGASTGWYLKCAE